MSWSFSARSQQERVGVHPHLLEVVEYARKFSPIDFGVHDGIRSIEEQRSYVNRKISWTMKSRHLKGEDGYGHAVDLVPYIGGKLRWEWAAIYELAECIAEASRDSEIPIRWGGVWDRRLANLEYGQLEMEVAQYGRRRRAKGLPVRTDGAHFELPKIKYYR